ncbi:MAG: helix-turn-helix transcriptional regulator [Turicibacter sp.]|nr:helix-turn-helix transcriptional regulator [Turicibacter sp.]
MKHYQYAKKLTQLRLSSNPNLHPGVIIRDKRLHLKLTLSELATNICNPSTLSKIEKGEYNKANSSLLSKLYARLNIKEIENLEHIDWLEAFRIQFYQYDFSTFNELSSELSFYYQHDLIQLGFSIFHENFQSFKEHIETLQKMCDYMSLQELQFYFYLLGRYYEKIYEGELCKNYYRLSYKIADELKLSDPLLYLSLANYYSLANNSFKACHFANLALAKFKSYYSIKYMIDCELLLSHECIKKGLLSQALPLLTQLNTKLNYSDSYGQRPKLCNIYGHYYVSLKEYEKAEKMYLKAIKEHSIPSEPILSLIKLYYESSQIIKLKKLLNQLKQHNFDFSHMKHLKHQYYYYLVYHSNSDVFRIFLLKKALPLVKKQHDKESIHLFSTSLIKFYQNNHKYKEALNVFLQLYETS